MDEPLVSLGNFVWLDSDRDGIQDEGEPGIEGVVLTLYAADANGDPTGGPLATTETDEFGFYLFDELAPGTYVVVVTAPDGMTATIETTGNPEGDSSTGSATSAALLEDGAEDMTLDFGFYEPDLEPPVVLVGMGNYVWIDTDKDGFQDGDEDGLVGVTVTLYSVDGEGELTEVGTTTTDIDGYYFFDSLLPGDYQVLFTLPTGYVFTTQTAGADVAGDSNPDTTTGFTATFTIFASSTGDTYPDVDINTEAEFVNMTIDAGVVLEDQDPENPGPVQPQDPGWPRGIPTTGSNSVMSLLLTALRLLIVGGGLMVIERRRRSSLDSR